MSATNWTVESSEKALDYISSEYNRLESFQEGLGERFFERLERIYERLKDKPLMFEQKHLCIGRH